MLYHVILGALTMGYAVISLFFLRYWRTTRDRFFLFFAVAFICEGIGRLISGLTDYSETGPYVYAMRLAAYLIIIAAIIDKNRLRKSF